MDVCDLVYVLARKRIAREQKRAPRKQGRCERCNGQGRRYRRERGGWVDYPCEACTETSLP